MMEEEKKDPLAKANEEESQDHIKTILTPKTQDSEEKTVHLAPNSNQSSQDHVKTMLTPATTPAPKTSGSEAKTVITAPPLNPKTKPIANKPLPASLTKKAPPLPKPPVFGKSASFKQVSAHASIVYDLFSQKSLQHSLDLEDPEGLFHQAPLARDKYTFVKDLAKGGMGFVDLVKDNDLNRYVARKCILPEFQRQADILERFAEEAQATGQLEHPNIIPIHDVGLDPEGQLYFTMKYIKGDTLEEVIQSLRENNKNITREYSLTRLLQIFQQMCHAIGFAHSKGVIHRDLKPANIMLGAFGEVIVMDWGLAKVIRSNIDSASTEENIETFRQQHGSKTVVGSVVGTPAYMPPEQALGQTEDLDEKSDVYSLGAILYEILTLEPPFGASGEVMKVLHDVVNTPVTAPDKAAANWKRQVPKELGAIALKAMNKEQKDRYPSVKGLLEDIQLFLEGKEVSALPDNFAKKIQRVARRHAKTLVWSGIFLFTLIFSLLMFWHSYRTYKIGQYLEKAKLAKINVEGVKIWLKEREEKQKAKMDSLNIYSETTSHNSIFTAYRDVIKEYRAVLELDPQNAEAKKELAWANFKLWEIGLLQKDHNMMKSYQKEVEHYKGNKWLEEIKGIQNITLKTKPANAEIYLFQYHSMTDYLLPIPYSPEKKHLEKDWLVNWIRKWVVARKKNTPENPLFDSVYPLPLKKELNFWGKTGANGSLILKNIEPGSYLLIVKHPDSVPQRFPFFARHPLLLKNKKTKTLSITLPPKSAVLPGFVYIPTSHFLYGGTSAAGAAPESWKDVEGFFIRKQEVTSGEYMKFLEDLCRQKNFKEAAARIPRSFYNDWKLFKINQTKEGLFEPGKDGSYLIYNEKLLELAKKRALREGKEWKGWKTRWKEKPVSGISYVDAKAFVGWKAKVDQREYRLPSEEEWELSARGVDGRKYSWGDQFNPKYVKLTQGYGNISVKQIGKWKSDSLKDESPFGVFHLAGNVAEWVEGFFDPAVKEGTPEASDPETLRVIRGNAWGLTPIGLECAFRTNGPQDYFHSTIGFRYCYSYKP